jgi:uncharacterized membrane protein
MNLILDNYSLEAIQDGRFAFAYGMHPLLFLLLAAALVGAVWWLYRSTTRQLSPGWKTWFITLRSSILLLLLFCLLRPIVTTHQVIPQETYLAVLIDDSQSMSIQDMNAGQSRQDLVREGLFGSSGLLASLNNTFQVRTFRFDNSAQRITSADELSASGNSSNLERALRFADDQLGGLALGGVVLISDGADNGSGDILALARDLGARQIPVFTVGAGQERIPRDVGISAVSAAKTVLEGSIFSVEVAVSQEGYEGQEIELSIMDGRTTAASRRVTLGADGTTRRYEMELTPERREAIAYEVRITEMPGEMVLQNNRYRFLVDNSERPPLDILYVEGHPRNEYKFIRRAVEGDETLRVASYLQTGPGRYYRQGIRTPLELNDGFPRNREELYQYEGIILGDIGRDFFNADQLQMLQDFVAERGGGLLVSGNIEDLLANTLIADILPVTLVGSNSLPAFLQGGSRRGNHPTGELYRPRVTNAGEYSPLLRLDSDDGVNRQIWRDMPELQGIYVTGRPKPGASVLMEHPVLQFQNQPVPVIATQRYGNGRSMVITTASTWRWQMLMPSENDSHERLWRQMLRWLAVSAPERVSVQFDREYYNAGDTVSVTATVLDSGYMPDNNASLWMQRTDPFGESIDSPMSWDLERDGVYHASFIAQEEGIYRVLVDVASAAAEANREETEKTVSFMVAPSLREYSRAGRDTGLLTRIAEASGGRYYNLNQLSQLAVDIGHTPNAYSREIQKDLWDTPLLLALLIALLCIDWATRRLKGLS